MASSYPAPVSAVQVGSYFVGRYYHVLQQQPEYAHQFYTDASTMLRVDGDETESASAMLQIYTLITSLNFTSIEIKTINSLESWSGGVLVVVSGSVKTKDFLGRRKFVQTFLLAPQEKGYFVLNDIFHFVNEEVIHQHTAPILSENNFDSQEATSSPLLEQPVSNYTLEEEASDYVNSVHIEGDDPVEEYGLEEEQQQQDPERRNLLESLKNFLMLLYCELLKGNLLPSVAAQPSFTTSTPPASEWHHPLQPIAQQMNSALSFVPESSVDAAEEGLSQEEGESKSVYVRNLPSTVSAADIEQEFRNFGRIQLDGVFIRNRKDVGVCYAFVEFEDVQSVQNAVKASPILLAGRQVYIEERRANSGSSSRGGTVTLSGDWRQSSVTTSLRSTSGCSLWA
ncbi:hypothetical protein F0562_002389 [Nyssa sinensis]|uniref:RRM domain-containing protein n=1 Tax=Nyssa sinensis TaxID=561372 RepID=A0A5J5C5L9_9ASTE|nr:hypothetical protein F0562_002389 [Nyssa sinensis]